MAWAIFTDQEQLDLLDAAAEMAAAALAARSRRIDEDGVLRRSVDMSRIKLHTLRQAFRQAPMAEYEELSDEDQRHAGMIIAAWAHAKTDQEKNAVWQAIRAIVLLPGKKEPQTGGAEPWGDDDLPKPEVAGDTARAARKPPKVRNVRLKAGSRKSPSGAAE